jgi:hypothetical protein
VFLNEIGKALLNESKDVYMIDDASCIHKQNRTLEDDLRALDGAGKLVYLLIDEVQSSESCIIWNFLLKDATNIVIIGVGVSKPHIISGTFSKTSKPSLFLIHEEELHEYVDYFTEMWSHALAAVELYYEQGQASSSSSSSSSSLTLPAVEPNYEQDQASTSCAHTLLMKINLNCHPMEQLVSRTNQQLT